MYISMVNMEVHILYFFSGPTDPLSSMQERVSSGEHPWQHVCVWGPEQQCWAWGQWVGGGELHLHFLYWWGSGDGSVYWLLRVALWPVYPGEPLWPFLFLSVAYRVRHSIFCIWHLYHLVAINLLASSHSTTTSSWDHMVSPLPLCGLLGEEVHFLSELCII